MASPLELVAAPLRGFKSHAAWQTGQRQICVQARSGIRYRGVPQDIIDACSPQASPLLSLVAPLATSGHLLLALGFRLPLGAQALQ